MAEPLRVLALLGDEVERVAHRPPPRRARRRGRSGLLALAGAVTVSAAALAAAGGILPGAPVRDRPGTPRAQPTVGGGTIVPGSVRVSPLRVADPGGGPPWSIRTFTTTRALGCLQVGRVVDGQLGLLGRDGVFGDDGRFHPLAPTVQEGRSCQPLDGAGRLYAAVSSSALAASASTTGCRASAAYAPLAGFRSRLPATCPTADERILFFGTLGAQARTVRFRGAAGGSVRAATAGADGGYLVVLRPGPGRPARGQWYSTPSPVSGLTGVDYAGGRRCAIPDPRRHGGGRACPRVGFVPVATARPRTAEIAAPVSARFDPRPASPGPAAGPAEREWVLHLSFAARTAAGPRSDYVISTRLPHSCRGSLSVQPLGRDVEAGTRVSATVSLPVACRGAVHGVVAFAPAPAGGGDVLDGRDDVPVGRFTASIPPR